VGICVVDQIACEGSNNESDNTKQCAEDDDGEDNALAIPRNARAAATKARAASVPTRLASDGLSSFVLRSRFELHIIRIQRRSFDAGGDSRGHLGRVGHLRRVPRGGSIRGGV